MKDNMTTYYITLEPLEPFFFGLEKLGESGNKNNYYQKSAFYPQQTAILGMFRYLLGDMNNQNFTPQLIGEKSFDSTMECKADYGVIDSISPVFVVRGEAIYTDSPFDKNFKLRFEEREIYLNNISKKYIPIVEGYDAKKGIEKHLISSEGTPIPFMYEFKNDGIFSVQAKDGNQKSRDGELNDSGYYKYEYVSMNQAQFGCFVTFKENSFIKENFTRIVFLGGNRSPFKLKVVKKVESNLFRQSVYIPPRVKVDFKAIRLLSDTYLEPKWVEKADFAITELVGFRNLQTSQNTKNWSGLSIKKGHGNTQPYFSERFNLLKKGSVLYFLDEQVCQQVGTEITKFQNFIQIGYNHFITI